MKRVYAWMLSLALLAAAAYSAGAWADPEPAAMPAMDSMDCCGEGACCAVDGTTRTSAYKIGDKVSDFALAEASTGKVESLSKLSGENATALIFWNQQCPFVQEAQDRIAAFHKEMADKGVKVVALDAGVNNPLESIQTYAKEKPFPILVNPNSNIAAMFGANHTPEVFLLNKEMQIVYHGAFDSGALRGGQTERADYLRDAVAALIAGKELAQKETKAFGCSLKYAEGVKPLDQASS